MVAAATPLPAELSSYSRGSDRTDSRLIAACATTAPQNQDRLAPRAQARTVNRAGRCNYSETRRFICDQTRGYGIGRVRRVAAEGTRLLRTCSDQEWGPTYGRRRLAGWPGCAPHRPRCAETGGMVWTQSTCAGEQTGDTADSIHAWNADEARQAPRSRAETVAPLKESRSEARRCWRD